MRTKLCPLCGAEYFEHVYECVDCHVELKCSDQLAREEDERESFLESSGGEVAVVREGGQSWLKECRAYLASKGVDSFLSTPAGCKPGNCSPTVSLVVAKQDLEDTDRLLYDYYLERHPDAADEAAVDGDETCPACGYHAGTEATECPDCGLALALD